MLLLLLWPLMVVIYFLPKELLPSLMNQLFYLIMRLKKPTDWVILDSSALENFISIVTLLLNAFLNLVLCFVINNNSWDNKWWSKLFCIHSWYYSCLIFDSSFLFACESDHLTFTLLYSVICTLCLQNFCCSLIKFTVPLDFLRTVYSLNSTPATPLKHNLLNSS